MRRSCLGPFEKVLTLYSVNFLNVNRLSWNIWKQWQSSKCGVNKTQVSGGDTPYRSLANVAPCILASKMRSVDAVYNPPPLLDNKVADGSFCNNTDAPFSQISSYISTGITLLSQRKLPQMTPSYVLLFFKKYFTKFCPSVPRLNIVSYLPFK